VSEVRGLLRTVADNVEEEGGNVSNYANYDDDATEFAGRASSTVSTIAPGGAFEDGFASPSLSSTVVAHHHHHHTRNEEVGLQFAVQELEAPGTVVKERLAAADRARIAELEELVKEKDLEMAQMQTSVHQSITAAHDIAQQSSAATQELQSEYMWLTDELVATKEQLRNALSSGAAPIV
jgi:hypothetical protein